MLARAGTGPGSAIDSATERHVGDGQLDGTRALLADGGRTLGELTTWVVTNRSRALDTTIQIVNSPKQTHRGITTAAAHLQLCPLGQHRARSTSQPRWRDVVSGRGARVCRFQSGSGRSPWRAIQDGLPGEPGSILGRLSTRSGLREHGLRGADLNSQLIRNRGRSRYGRPRSDRSTTAYDRRERSMVLLHDTVCAQQQRRLASGNSDPRPPRSCAHDRGFRRSTRMSSAWPLTTSISEAKFSNTRSTWQPLDRQLER